MPWNSPSPTFQINGREFQEWGIPRKMLPKGKRGASATNSLKSTVCPCNRSMQDIASTLFSRPGTFAFPSHHPCSTAPQDSALMATPLFCTYYYVVCNCSQPVLFMCIPLTPPRGDGKILEGRHFAFSHPLDSFHS